ncbi:glutathione S-transferase family protein [Alteromonas oceanisediminis]|uniref:glutathione S-transferase family protein n=1 Tax=Alteromonas oceanisediminis TaxID=2836180 RepID=UPI001BD9B368|nr:glutathione S-transferase family protein [Alteromonas oceanisediminis]MBT0588101.1 glutathione S-transferase family protein [Alteromonas oceanisediminis]
MLTIYGYSGTRSIRATWAAEELGIAYEYQCVDLKRGLHKSPEYLAVAATGKVPSLRDDGLTITESGAIVTYLADQAGRLIPSTGTAKRGKYEEAMYFVHTELEQPLWSIGKHKFALPEDKRIEQNISLGEWEFQQVLSVFAKMLGDQTYLLGDTFSVADVAAGHTLSWAKGFKQALTHDNVIEYAERVLTRPALARARQREAEAVSVS